MKPGKLLAARQLVALYERLRAIHGRARGLAESCEDAGNWRQVQLLLGRKALALRRRVGRAHFGALSSGQGRNDVPHLSGGGRSEAAQGVAGE